jgi:hypothetical protein
MVNPSTCEVQMKHKYLISIALWLVLAAVSGAPARGQTPSATRPMFTHQPSVEEIFLPELTSGDPSRVKAAVARLEKFTQPHWANRATNLAVLLEAKMYAQADQSAVNMILYDPATTAAVAELQKLRVAALLSEGQPDKALAAAKAYYDVSPFANTADAISLVSLCLTASYPEDPAIVRRFKLQQVAWSAATTQPSADLGDAILSPLQVDGLPFEDAIAGIKLTDFKKFAAKGNLLLLSGRALEAQAVFEQAEQVASVAQTSDAIEGAARAIRAQNGCVGPANAYILRIRNQQQ